MNLYEITNGYTGESYVRAYAWASSEQEARDLAYPAFLVKRIKGGYEDAYSERLHVALLFSADSQPFSTQVSSDGWETADYNL